VKNAKRITNANSGTDVRAANNFLMLDSLMYLPWVSLYMETQ